MGRRARLTGTSYPAGSNPAPYSRWRSVLTVAGGFLILALSSPRAAPPVPVAPSAGIVATGAQPLWVRDGRLTDKAQAALHLMAQAERHGLNPDHYVTPGLNRAIQRMEEGSSASAAILAEQEISGAFLRYALDLRRSAEPIYVADPQAIPFLNAEALLQKVGRNGPVEAVRLGADYENLAEHLSAWRTTWLGLPHIMVPPGPEVHPGRASSRIRQLRKRLGLPPGSSPDALDPVLTSRLRDFQRWHGLRASGVLDSPTTVALNRNPRDYERLILSNMDRLRILPPSAPSRSIRVNVATGQLTGLEDGKAVISMKVVVGRKETPTPMLVGVMRYLVLNPYWNLPQDIVRDRIAPRVISGGDAALREEGLEALPDWSPAAKPLMVRQVNWEAVAAGRQRLRVRQKPGPENMMGDVKFMLPNDLGIYLHDTPARKLFLADQRTFSAGCVRLEDAQALGRWLMGLPLEDLVDGSAEQKINLSAPLPVFLIYQTVEPRPGGGLLFGPDPYGWDERPGALHSRSRGSLIDGKVRKT